MKNKLMVKLEGKWEYVLCTNGSQVITTNNRSWATSREIFQSDPPFHQFRICTGVKCAACGRIFVPNSIGICRKCKVMY